MPVNNHSCRRDILAEGEQLIESMSFKVCVHMFVSLISGQLSVSRDVCACTVSPAIGYQLFVQQGLC